ncbi:MAG: hypothetical protein HUU60_06930 [Armatimonadetes bacterium]|nr:hypothetical protein [Armatimonadota bacterium]
MQGQNPRPVATVIELLKSINPDMRMRGIKMAAGLGGEGVFFIATVAASEDRAQARAAMMALHNLVHHAARPESREARDVATQLLELAQGPRSRFVWTEAFYLLGLIGDRSIVPQLAKLLENSERRYDARMALERIPGRESLAALKQAHKGAVGDFREALAQSIEARETPEKSLGIRR